MTENFDTSRRRARLITAAGIFVSLVVAGVVFLVIRLATSGFAAEAAVTHSVVVAARDIAGRKPIEEADLQMRVVEMDETNANAFTRMDDVLGRVSSVSIPEGQIVTRNLLASHTANQAFSVNDPAASFDPSGPDWRAVSLTVPDPMAVAGTIQPGQRVDVVVTMSLNPQIGLPADQAQPAETPAEFVPGPSTRVTLQNMTVLARNGAVYILRAELDTAEKIGQLIAAGGQFMIVLRPDEDTRTAETGGSTTDSLVDEFGFRVPKRPPLDGEPGMASPEPAASASAAP